MEKDLITLIFKNKLVLYLLTLYFAVFFFISYYFALLFIRYIFANAGCQVCTWHIIV